MGLCQCQEAEAISYNFAHNRFNLFRQFIEFVMPENDDPRLYQSPRYWDELAAAFDDEPDHGLNNPAARRAWMNELAIWLPPDRASVLDVGCGTGTLSLVMAESGHRVTGIDWSPAMIAQAEMKAAVAGLAIDFRVGDAADPQLYPQQFDAILCRHVLWALSEPAKVLRRWAALLAPNGRLILIEGYWHTGGGLHTTEIVAALPPSLTDVQVHDLSGRPLLWGGEVADERYVVVAHQTS
jgi:2-polyprenyl-3-methyl-5-hydroxy-6-metoxy-1,4-benzoquinol methylase